LSLELKLAAFGGVDKVGVPTPNTTIMWTPIFGWYVLRCGSKNGHLKDNVERRLDYILNIGSHYLLHMLTILSSRMQPYWEDPYDQLMNTRLFIG
jgi:hypothetical protein